MSDPTFPMTIRRIIERHPNLWGDEAIEDDLRQLVHDHWLVWSQEEPYVLEWELFKLPIAVDPRVRRDISAAIRAALANQPAAETAGLDVEALTVIAGISENRVTRRQAEALGWLDGYLARFATSDPEPQP